MLRYAPTSGSIFDSIFGEGGGRGRGRKKEEGRREGRRVAPSPDNLVTAGVEGGKGGSEFERWKVRAAGAWGRGRRIGRRGREGDRREGRGRG